jgi:hypothetical protein
MKASTRHDSRKKDRRATHLPQPGRKKKDPRELDKLLDKGIEDSMTASDPPAVTQPEVHEEADRERGSVESARDKSGRHNV